MPQASLPNPAICTGLSVHLTVDKIKTHTSRSLAQTISCLEQFAIETCGLATGQELPSMALLAQGLFTAETWNALGRDKYVEYHTQHLSHTALRVACFLHGVPLTTGATATALANALFDLRALPVSASDLKNWYARYCIIRLGITDPGPSYSAPTSAPESSPQGTEEPTPSTAADTRRPRSPGRPNNNRSPSRNSSRRSPSRRGRSRSPERRRSPPPPLSSAGTDNSDRLAQAILRALASRPPPLEDMVKPGVCKFEDFIAKQKKLIENRQIVMIELLGGAYAAKLRGSTYTSRKVQLAPGVFFTTNDTEADPGKDLGPNAIREGFDVYIRLHQESPTPAIRALAADRALFNEQLWQLPVGSFKEKAEYIKAFMAIYYKHDVWTPLIRSDVVLFRILTASAYNSLTVKSEPDRGGRGDQGGRVNHGGKGDRQDRGRGGKGGKGGSSDGYTVKDSAKYCNTRLDPAAGRCIKGRHCPYDHHCASCLGFHAAANCTSFSASKAAANARLKT